MPRSLDAYLHAKNQRYQMIPSKDISEEKLCNLISREATGHPQTKVGVTDATFPI